MKSASTGPIINFPLSAYNIFKRLKQVTLIYPLYPIMPISFESIVEAVGFEDEIYFALSHGEELEDSEKIPLAHSYWDVVESKEIRLRNVSKIDWMQSFGPRNPLAWMQWSNVSDLDTPVKILKLRKVDYSLSELNRKYGKKTRKPR